MAELERQLASAHRESQDRAAKATAVWAEGQHAAEWATTAEQGLKAAKARQAKTEVALWKSLVDTKAMLQATLETLKMEQNALEMERKARSEADQEVLALRGRVMGMEEANA